MTTDKTSVNVNGLRKQCYVYFVWLSQLQYHTAGKPQFPWLFPDQRQIPRLFQVDTLCYTACTLTKTVTETICFRVIPPNSSVWDLDFKDTVGKDSMTAVQIIAPVSMFMTIILTFRGNGLNPMVSPWIEITITHPKSAYSIPSGFAPWKKL